MTTGSQSSLPGHIGAVAVNTLGRRGFVKEHRFALHKFDVLVASLAGRVLVRALKRKDGSGLMVKH